MPRLRTVIGLRFASMENFRRIEVHYNGHVQGVGFRYRAQSIAHQFDVAGYVRNLDDGRVHIVAEGEKDELISFMREIDQQMERFIRNKNVIWSAAHNQFTSFEIRT